MVLLLSFISSVREYKLKNSSQDDQYSYKNSHKRQNRPIFCLYNGNHTYNKSCNTQSSQDKGGERKPEHNFYGNQYYKGNT